ncbi:MAG: von Willebrand factor type A domain-containing protein [Rhizobiaceae bacterium]
MDDRELKLLGKMPMEKPDAKRRAAALSAAMDAFDEQKFSSSTQGSASGNRLSSRAADFWRAMMERKLSATPTIAGILALPIAGYAAWYLAQETPFAIGDRLEPADINETAGKKDANFRPQEEKLKGEATSADDKRVRQQLEVDTVTAGRADSDKEERAVDGLREAENLVVADEARPNAVGTLQAAAPQPKLLAEKGRIMLPEPVIVEEQNRDRFENFDTNPVKQALRDPVSTFSIDVDTASYSFVRSALMRNGMPNPDAVRVEEMINYFPYNWAGPENISVPFNSTVTVMPSPWNENTKLMHVAIKGYDVQPSEKPRANLVFLIDTSGSMNQPDKLPLLKTSFRMLLDRLDAEDTISIVTYAGSAGTALEPTKASEKSKILNVIDSLGARGSTAGAAGIEQAYRLAEQAFVKDGVNRVMLATDGDFNVGVSDDASLKRIIEKKRESGIFLSVFGFGHGNYNDQLMQTLAQNGNGQAAYIDTVAEAQKTLVEEAGSTLFPIAKDVKIQVEFNPARVAEYRLIGYETRALKREDFNNDRIDAGDIGSGHSVTAIYEITPIGSPAVTSDALRYAANQDAQGEKPVQFDGDRPVGVEDEYAFLKLRYKLPDEDTSKLITTPVTVSNEVDGLGSASDDQRFSVAVAAFGQKLRDTDQTSNYGYDEILKLAQAARGSDPYGYRAEFLSLVRIADALD